MGVSPFRILDFLILMLAVLAVAAAGLWSVEEGSGELRAEVKTSGELYLLPAGRDGELSVSGPVGETVILVENGAVRVTHSDCPEKICIAMGEVSGPQGWIACLPNRVFIRMRAVESEDVDVVVF